MAPVVVENFPNGLTVQRDGAQAPGIELHKNGDMRVTGQLVVGSLQLGSGGGTVGLTLDNDEFLSGLTTAAVVKRLIGVSSADVVALDADALGASFGGTLAITGLLSLTAGLNLGTAQAINGTTSININETGGDVDVRIESDTNTLHFSSDAGAFNGVGAFGFGIANAGGAGTRAFIFESIPATTTSGTTSWFHHLINPIATTTFSGSTQTIAATLGVFEPVITGGTVTLGATVYIADAPTEGANNYALYVAAGGAFFASTVTAASYVVGAQVGTSGTFSAVTVVNGIVVSGT